MQELRCINHLRVLQIIYIEYLQVPALAFLIYNGLNDQLILDQSFQAGSRPGSDLFRSSLERVKFQEIKSYNYFLANNYSPEILNVLYDRKVLA